MRNHFKWWCAIISTIYCKWKTRRTARYRLCEKKVCVSCYVHRMHLGGSARNCLQQAPPEKRSGYGGDTLSTTTLLYLKLKRLGRTTIFLSRCSIPNGSYSTWGRLQDLSLFLQAPLPSQASFLLCLRSWFKINLNAGLSTSFLFGWVGGTSRNDQSRQFLFLSNKQTIHFWGIDTTKKLGLGA